MTIAKIKVLHFATGGFSGVTHMVIDLIQSMQNYEDIHSLLVLRKKKNTESKLAYLNEQNIDYQLISAHSHLSSIYQLKRICQQWQPDVLIAHGFPEHLIGRWAGYLAGVPHLIQVEHASKERYTTWRLWQSQFLSQHTDAIIGVSQGVTEVLKSQSLKNTNIQTICNGIDCQKYSEYASQPLAQRPHDITMVARFAKGKNHGVLFKALSLLKQQGLTPMLNLVGTGGRHMATAKQQVADMELTQQVKFLGHSDQVAQLLAEHKIFVMASYHEGLSLSVIEAMSAGCIVVGSDVVGVRELIIDGQDGFLFDINDANALANILQQILTYIEVYQVMAIKAQQKAFNHYDKTIMAKNYYQLIKDISNKN
ncbi:glycosyltransferase family 4 protein [Psychrobacter sp. I-STPA10]|uniref:glycosyltransferase family 4 protein n=1 Tax=Psychrobacter sp. I-STPA10 TaxID=2585769 RepID=UPI001E35EA31|nr:glycosyltransferase family 4 protein [Psychrobacter sp. I-STPA10]